MDIDVQSGAYQIQTVQKHTVILNSTQDWRAWFQIKREQAIRLSIWEYVDPSGTEDMKTADPEPVEPSFADYIKAGRQDGAPPQKSDLTAEERRYWREDRSDWKEEHVRWLARQKHYESFAYGILISIGKDYLFLLEKVDNLRERLRVLQRRFSPGIWANQEAVRAQYRSLQKMPKQANLDQWFDDWTRIIELGEDAGLPEFKDTTPQKDFIKAVSSMNSVWSNQKLMDLIDSTDDSSKPFPDIKRLVEQFRHVYHIQRPIASTLSTFSATLEVAEEKEKAVLYEGKKEECWCGKQHKLKDCWYINNAHPRKPKGWKPSASLAEKLEELKLERSKEGDRIRKAIRDYETRETAASSTSPKPLDGGKRATGELHTHAVRQAFSSKSPYTLPPLLNRWILDPGSDVHVCNSKAFGWKAYEDLEEEESYVFAGGQKLRVEQWGSVIVTARGLHGQQKWQLSHVAYIPSFLTNIVALSRCLDLGIHFDSGRHCLYQERTSNVICKLEFNGGHWLFDSDESARPDTAALMAYAARSAHLKPSKEPKANLQITRAQAHEIWAHASPDAIKKLPQAVTSIELVDGGSTKQWRKCETCISAKLTQQISRRGPTEKAQRPFFRISVDLVQLLARPGETLGGEKYLFHLVDEHSGWHEGVCLLDRRAETLLHAFKRFVSKILRCFHYVVVRIKLDNDRSFSEFIELAKSMGYIVEPRPADTPQPGGGIEKAGELVMRRARALAASSKLPRDQLAAELAITAVQVLNHTPMRRLGWKTPYEIVHGRRPTVTHFSRVGTKAFTLNKHIPRGDKLAPRALIGYLVGWDSTNIWRVWMPSAQKVIRTRDVVFLEGTHFEENQIYAPPAEVVEVIDLPEADEPSAEELAYAMLPRSQPNEPNVAPGEPLLAVEDSEVLPSVEQQQEIDHQIAYGEKGGPADRYPTPGDSPGRVQHESGISQYDSTPESPRVSLGLGEDPQDSSIRQLQAPIEKDLGGEEDLEDLDSLTAEVLERTTKASPGRPKGKGRELDPVWKGYQQVRPGEALPDRKKNNAPRRGPDPNARKGIDPSVIISEGRSSRRWDPEAGAHAVYLGTFAASLENPLSTTGTQPAITRIHRDELPDPPKRWSQLKTHPHGEEFKKAAQAEYDACWKRGVFKETSVTPEDAEAEVLPLKWVFTYKFNQDGYLCKHKARLVVRGDLQLDWPDTYAATLALKVFRFLMALATAFDLSAYQYDVTNAFLNAMMARLVYVRAPEGYRGGLLELRRALYGLKEAPKLWYNTFTRVLDKLGLKPVKGVPCVYSSDHLIVFFYVDDIVVLIHPSKICYKEGFEKHLMNEFDIKILGEIKWFLGIRVIRDRQARKLWLLQDSYIDKVTAKYGINTPEKDSGAPMSDNTLEASAEEPDEARTRRYNELTGSLAFAACCTRVDVARAHSVLSRHLINPGTRHMKALERVWEYLSYHKYMALTCSGDMQQHQEWNTSRDDEVPGGLLPLPGDLANAPFLGASDAAFADDAPTRRSSQGYLFMCYSMPIEWKVTLQKCVTKSTTEAELISLSAMASEWQWWNRFFQRIHFDMDTEVSLYCDNQQTVRAVTADEEKLQTKLKHVDIHSCWLRQEVRHKRVKVEWMPTNAMPADGLTKCLTRQKHKAFLKQLRMEDVRSRIEPQVSYGI